MCTLNIPQQLKSQTAGHTGRYSDKVVNKKEKKRPHEHARTLKIVLIYRQWDPHGCNGVRAPLKNSSPGHGLFSEDGEMLVL